MDDFQKRLSAKASEGFRRIGQAGLGKIAEQLLGTAPCADGSHVERAFSTTDTNSFRATDQPHGYKTIIVCERCGMQRVAGHPWRDPGYY